MIESWQSKRTLIAGADIKTIDELGTEFCRELEEFFVNYHRLWGKEYRVLDVKGPAAARKLVKSSPK